MPRVLGGVLPRRRDEQRVFWRAIGAGLSIADASACLGVSVATGRRLFGRAGGMPPLSLVEPGRTRTMNIGEREQILAGMNQGLSVRAIAAGIGRAPSTVSRELARNMTHKYGRVAGAVGRPRVRAWSYSPHASQRRADLGAARPKLSRLAQCPVLHRRVAQRLEDEHSPEQIAARLRVDFPDDPEMWVSHETIYKSLYVQGKGSLRRDLAKWLRTGRAVRKPRRRTGQRRARIPDMVNISQRPPEVEDRAVPGHWEGDLIVGAHSGSAIGTLAERMTGYVMLLHLPGDHGADAVQQAMLVAMAGLPASLKKTLTWDQGIEMANHVQIAAASDLDIYFCDPHSAWQRGTNENTNGLLRQYFAKGADLSLFAPDYLDHVATKLNNRPRKRLGWKTPAEALDELLSDPSDPPGVALTG